MAHIANFDAERFGELVQGVAATAAFNVKDTQKLGGMRSFTELSNADTILYRAEGQDGDWEVGLGTYASATSTLARTAVLYSSNSDQAVDFSGKNVKLVGLNKMAGSAYTVTNFVADRSLAGNESTTADVAAVLATVINDLIEAGVLRGTVSVPA